MSRSPARVRPSLRRAALFVGCLAGAAFAHELGHALAAWAQGIPVVPTLLKEYTLRESVHWVQYQWIALGGVVGSLLNAMAAVAWYARRERSTGEIVLAGALVMPCAYTLRFALAGRGHDGLEWQAAQVALGVSPASHLVDVLFLAVSIAGLAVWLVRRSRTLGLRTVAYAAGVQLAGIAVLVVLQVANNAAFDRFFPSSKVLDVPFAAREPGRSPER